MDDVSSDTPSTASHAGAKKQTGNKRSLFQRIWHPEPVPPEFARRNGEPVLIPERTASYVVSAGR